jgi:uncharacterized membrane protein
MIAMEMSDLKLTLACCAICGFLGMLLGAMFGAPLAGAVVGSMLPWALALLAVLMRAVG